MSLFTFSISPLGLYHVLGATLPFVETVDTEARPELATVRLSLGAGVQPLLTAAASDRYSIAVAETEIAPYRADPNDYLGTPHPWQIQASEVKRILPIIKRLVRDKVLIRVSVTTGITRLSVESADGAMDYDLANYTGETAWPTWYFQEITKAIDARLLAGSAAPTTGFYPLSLARVATACQAMDVSASRVRDPLPIRFYPPAQSNRGTLITWENRLIIVLMPSRSHDSLEPLAYWREYTTSQK